MMSRAIATATLAFTIAAPPAAAQTTGERAGGRDREQLYLEVVLNGVATGRLLAVVREHGVLTADAATVRSLGLPIDTPDDERVVLDAMTDAVVRYDPLGQRLHIDRRPATLPGQRLSAGHTVDLPETRTSGGMLVNYDLHHRRHADGTHATTSWIEGRTFGNLGVLSATARYEQRAQHDTRAAFIRHDTTWSKTDRQRRLVFSAGDVVTGVHGWSTAIRLGGLSIARNFALRPDLVTHPVPEFAGEAAVPGAVELLLNGRHVMERHVQPGPFAIHDVPVVNGAGSATIVTTDAVGRQTTRTVAFYVSTSLLRKGLVDYSVSLGAVRRGYGLDSFDYGPLVGSGVVRYGLTNALTIEGLAAVSPAVTSGGAGASVRIGHLGVAGTSFSLSSDSTAETDRVSAPRTEEPPSGRIGHRYTLRYEYQASRIGLLVRRDARSSGFAEPGLADLATSGQSMASPDRLLQLFVSLSPSRSMPVSAGYIRTDSRSGAASMFTLSTSRPIGRQSRLAIAGVYRRGTWSLQASMSMRMGRSATAHVSAARTTDGRGAVRTSFHRPAPIDGGLGLDIASSVEGTGERHGAVTWRTHAVEIQAGADSRAGATTAWASARGSIVAAGRTLVPTGRVSDAFILVDTNGHAGIPVLFENRRIGRTNRHGRLLVPGVSAYHAARIAIDPLHLPADVQVDATDRRVAVERHAGTVVTFPLRRLVSTSVRLVDVAGAPLPVGTRVVHEQTGATLVVGWTGLVYVQQVTRSNTLVATLADGATCVAAFGADARPLRPGAVMRQTCHR